MRMKNILLATVLGSGLLVSGIPVSDAQARSFMLQPNSNWAVSKIEATQLGGDSYCAMARRFNQNIILTLARNVGDESSLAIDFQANKVNRSNTYDVTIDPGHGQSRTMSVRPVSDKALVLRLGRDFAFYDALNRSGKLDVSIDRETYSFDITDYQTGQRDLNACLVSLTEPAAGSSSMQAESVLAVDEKPLPRAAESSPASSSVVSRPSAGRAVEALDDLALPARGVADAASVAGDVDISLSDLRAENQRLRRALNAERKAFEDRYQSLSMESSRAAELNQRLSALQSTNDDLRTRLAETSMKLSNLESSQNAGQCQAEQDRRMETLAGEATRLRDENATLRAEMDALRSATRMSADTTSGQPEQIARLQEALKEAEQAAMSAEERAAGLTAQLAESRAKVAAREARLEELDSKMMEAQQGALSAEGEVRAEVEDLRQQLAQARADIETARAARETAESQARAAKQSLAAAQDKLTALSLHPALPADGEAAGVGSDELNRTNVAQAGLIQTLESRIDFLAAENRQLQTQLARSLKEKDDLAVQLTAQPAHGFGEKPVAPAKFAALQERLDQVIAERDGLRMQIASHNEDAPSFSFSSDNWDLEQATKRYNEAEAEIRRLGRMVEQEREQCMAEKRDIEEMLFDPAIATQKQIETLRTLRQDVDMLEAKLESERSMTSGKVAQLQAQKEKMTMELAALEEALTERETRLSSNQSRLQDAEQKLTLLQDDANQKREVVDQLNRVQRDYDSLQSEHAQLKKERTELSSRVESMQIQIAASEELIEEETRNLSTQVAALEQALSDKENEMRAQQQEMQDLELALAAAEEIVSAREEQIAQLKSRAEDGSASFVAMQGVTDPATNSPMGGASHAAASTLESTGERQVAAIARAGQVVRAPLQSASAADFENWETGVAGTAVAGKVSRIEPAAGVTGSRHMASSAALWNAGRVEAFLVNAGAGPDRGVQLVDAVSDAGFAAFIWQSGSLYGSAEQMSMSSPSDDYDNAVQAYVEKTRARCPGEFAAIPADDSENGDLKVSAYELACVGDEQQAAASVVFIGQGDLFTVIAHETPLESMDIAIDARDAIWQHLLTTRLASR